MATADASGAGPDFDAAFYVAAYPDLAELTSPAARAHFERLGRSEGRHGALGPALEALQARWGRLPADFDAQAYAALHADVAARSPFRIAEHYLTIGRPQARPYSAADLAARRARQLGRLDAPLPAPRVHRSQAEAGRLRLQRMFAAPAVDDALVRGVASALAAAAQSRSPAAGALNAAVVGRWLLSGPGAGAGDFARLSTQLQALHFALVACPAMSRTAAEMAEVNRAAALAIAAEVADCAPIPLTLFMLMARAAAFGADPHADLARPEAAVAAFFGRDVIDLGLQRYVTRAQRAALRTAGPGGASWAEAMRAAHRPARGAGSAAGASGASPPFWSAGVWTDGMDYVLCGAQLAASQVAVRTCAAGAPRLEAPGFLLNAAEDLDPDQAQAWLRRWVQDGAPELGPWPLLVAPSAAAYACGWAEPPPAEPPPASAGQPQGFRADAVQPGQLVTFGRDSAGARLAIGEGWAAPAPHHGRIRGEAALAFGLRAPEGEAFDLFLDVAAASRDVERLAVVWNGRLAAAAPLAAAADGWLQLHLGPGRAGPEPNALRLVALPRDPQMRGPRRLVLRRLMVAAR